VIENGVYGERIAQMCARSAIPHDRLVGSWQGALSDTAFRISTMGNLTSADVDRLVQCFSEAIPLGT
jgi:aspartate aminotransferase-like enzyme